MRFIQRVFCLQRLNKIVFAFLSAGTLPGADEKNLYAFLSAGTLLAAAQ